MYYYTVEFGKRKKNTNKYNSSLSLQVYEYAQNTVGPVSSCVPHPPDLNFLLLCSMSAAHDITFSQWYPEVNLFCKEVSITIVGCKADLHKDKSQATKPPKNGLEPVTSPRSHEMVKAMGVMATASAHPNPRKVHAAFHKVAEVALSSHR